MFTRYKNLADSDHAQPRVAMILACGNNVMAASWHMPISREPFRYAVAVRPENRTHDMLKHHGTFTLNCLPYEHFATTDMTGRYHFGETDKRKCTELLWHPSDVTGDTIFDDAVFAYECRLFETAAHGDHTLFMADVLNIYVRDNEEMIALFSGKGRYMTTTSPVQVPRRRQVNSR